MVRYRVASEVPVIKLFPKRPGLDAKNASIPRDPGLRGRERLAPAISGPFVWVALMVGGVG